MKVSIVLLNYNGAAHAPLWESVFLESYREKEIIFVDNGSTDGSTEKFRILAAKYPNVRAQVVRLERNVGYSGGNNFGIEYATGEIFCLLSSDVEVDRTWIAPIVRAMVSDRGIGCAQGVMYKLTDRAKLDIPSTEIDPLGFTHPLIAPTQGVKTVFFTEGAAMFARRSLLDELGYLFPREYFMMYEDVDFCWRAMLKGYRSVVVAESRAYHSRGGTVSGDIMKHDPWIVQTGTRNKLASLYCNYSDTWMRTILPVAMGAEVVKILVLWLIGLKREARASLAGVVRFLHDLGALRLRRKTIQTSRSVNDSVVLAKMVRLESVPRYLFSLLTILRSQRMDGS